MNSSRPHAELSEAPKIRLHAATDISASFRPLLEQGFCMQVEAGRTVQDVFCRQLAVAEDYLRDRVQTVFLNGKAVDDETSAIVEDGDRLALSAAMPGLAGATLRKGGFFSGFRSAISLQGTAGEKTRPAAAVITIKLFNMIAAEIGPLFLARGIGIKGRQLTALWDRLGDDFWQRVDDADINGRPCGLIQLKSTDWGEATVHLRLEAD
jgi:hypothetical protein